MAILTNVIKRIKNYVLPDKLADKKFPGPQKQRFKSHFRPTVLLVLLTIFALIIFIQALAYYSILDPTLVKFFPIEIDKTIIVFSSLLALSFTIRNFALSIRPILSYEYIISNESDMSLDGKVFQVKLRNAGPGMGIVTDAYYCLQLYGDSSLQRTHDPNDIVKTLKIASLIRHLNYEIFFPRPGYSLNTKEGRAFFEISPYDAKKNCKIGHTIKIQKCLG